jgi:hypothetical protein
LPRETIMDKSDTNKFALVVLLTVIIAARVPEVGELFGKLFELLQRPFTGAPPARSHRPDDAWPTPSWPDSPRTGGESPKRG